MKKTVIVVVLLVVIAGAAFIVFQKTGNQETGILKNKTTNEKMLPPALPD